MESSEKIEGDIQILILLTIYKFPLGLNITI